MGGLGREAREERVVGEGLRVSTDEGYIREQMEVAVLIMLVRLGIKGVIASMRLAGRAVEVVAVDDEAEPGGHWRSDKR